MRAISFAWTTPAVIARAKSVTRRNWRHSHAVRHEAGMRLTALTKDRRAGGRPFGEIRLTHNPVLESTSDMPDSDYAAEGFEWLYEHCGAIERASGINFGRICSRHRFDLWRREEAAMWVVRFEVVSIEEWAEAWLQDLLAGQDVRGRAPFERR